MFHYDGIVSIRNKNNQYISVVKQNKTTIFLDNTKYIRRKMYKKLIIIALEITSNIINYSLNIK